MNISTDVISNAGTQYTHVSTDVAFNATVSTQMVTIPILDNMTVADSTFFSVVLTSAEPAVVLHPAAADVTIEDDDCELSSHRSVLTVQYFTTKFFLNSVVTIGFSPDTTYTVAEDTGSVNVTVSVLNGSLVRGVSVVMVTSFADGTATGGIHSVCVIRVFTNQRY